MTTDVHGNTPDAIDREELLALLLEEEGFQISAGPGIEPRPDGGPAPLSFAQQRLWFLDRLAPGGTAYNVAATVGLRGPLDRDALVASLGLLLERHSVLRSRIVETDGVARQEVGDDCAPALTEVDLRDVDAGARRETADALLAEAVRRPFDLSTGPLVRFLLIRTGDREHLLQSAAHHIVCDGWSMGILTRELTAVYPALAAGRRPELGPPPVQYADFAAWQRRHLDEAALEPHLEYWRRTLAGRLPVLDLPTDRPRPKAATYRGASVVRRLPPAVAEGLKELGREDGNTLFMTLLAAFSVLLHRWSGQEDLLVGTPVANRNRPELEDVLGFFVNTLVMRCRLDGDPTFRQLAARVRETALGAFVHEDLPFERLVEELQPERSPDRHPLIQALFVLQNAPLELPRLGEVEVERLPTPEHASKFDVTLKAEEGEDGLELRLEYATDLFEAATAARMLDHLVVLLGAALEDPDRPVAELPLGGAGEELEPAEWTEPALDVPLVPVHRQIAAAAAATPEAPAVSDEEGTVAYGELDRRANRLARYLAALGAGPGVVVGICLAPSADLVTAVLAVLKTGAAYLPLDPEAPPERLAATLGSVTAEVLVTGSAVVETLPLSYLGAVVDLEAVGPEVELEKDAPVDGGASLEDLAYLISTSGSTGVPKGVAVAHGHLASYVAAVRRRLDLEGCSRFLLLSTFAADLGNTAFFPALCSGATLVVPSRDRAMDPNRLAELLAEEPVDCAKLTPSHLRVLLTAREPAAVLPRRRLVLGGEVLSWELVDRVQEHAPECRVLNHYGPSETTVGVAAGIAGVAPEARRSASVPVGLPLAGCRAVLLDRRGRPVPRGVPGELCIGGTQVSRGYVGRPGLTAAAFVPDPFAREAGGRLYRTGDLARRLPSGEIEILGRIDRQVKVRGYRVELGEIEAVLARHPAVAASAVKAVERGAGDRALVAYAVPAAGAELDREAVVAHLAAELPAYMVPADLLVLERLPLTPNGKVDLALLPDPERRSGTETRPVSPLEETLAGIWESVLGVEGVGRDDNFFDLGGHSVLATQVISRILAAVGVELPLLGLFDSPTVRGLARLVELHREGDPRDAAPPLAPVPREGAERPLSFAQERMWFLYQMDPDSPAYNMPAVLRLEGPLDAAALESALGAVVRRHEGLRSTFDRREGRPVLRLGPLPRRILETLDLTALPAARRSTVAEERLRTEARRPFDLTRGPLLRAVLVRLDDEEHRLLLCAHHVVSDGWSVTVLIQELGELYRAHREGRPAELPELSVQYADFADWQRRWLTGEVLDEQIGWWRERLGDDPAPLELPTDHPYPALQTFRGGRVDVHLDGELTAGLTELARRHDVTLFMLLMTAFQGLLWRYSGQRRISVGTPIAGRNRRELEPLVGLFVNTLVIRTELGDDPDVATLLARVREATLGAYAHQDLPFERLVEALQPDRDLGRTPLFQALFVWQNIPILPFELPDLRLTPLASDTDAAKFELTLSLQEGRDGLFGNLEYNADLFDRRTAERMVGHLETLLASLVRHPERRVSELDLLTDGERRTLLEVWNRTEDPAAARSSLVGRFLERADERPAATALACGDGSVTYRQLAERSAAAAGRLAALDVGMDDVVAVVGPRGLELTTTLLAVLRAGAAYLPLDLKQPARRILEVIRDSGAKLVVGPREELDRLWATEEQCDGARRVAWSELLAGGGPPAPRLPEDPAQLAYVIYTSGSTGKPKGVMVPRGGMVNHLQVKIDDLALTADDVVAQTASQSFDISVWQMFAALLVGGRVEIFDDGVTLDPQRLMDRVAATGVTVLELVPSHLGAALEAFGDDPERLPDLDRLRWLMVTGEVVSPRLCADWLRLCPATPLINAYGPTECSDDITHEVIDRPPPREAARVPIGSAVGNIRLYPLDRRGRPVPVGVPGELHAGGLGVGRGYLGDPAQTAERFVPDPFGSPGSRLYRTGDMVAFRADGRLDFLGRLDHQVKVRGFRIELGEVEAALLRQPRVREAVATARRDPAGIERLVAYVGSAEGHAPKAGELRAAVAEDLPDYMVPSVIRVLDRLPLTDNGKVDREALPPVDLGDGAVGRRIAPRNLLEHRLAEIWSETLGVADVGITDDYFALGGHSLLAVRLMALVQERLGRELPISALFQGPTVEHMAHLLRQRPDPALWSPLVTIRGAGRRTPLFLVHPTGGDVLCYRPLADLLGDDQPLHALQARGLDGEEEPVRDLEAMARRYLEAARPVHPGGPWRLGGWSFGGVVAYEMARQLRAAGEAVELVAVFDSLAPTAETGDGESRELSAAQWAAWFQVIGGEFERVFDQKLELPREAMAGLEPERQLEVFLEALSQVDFLPPGSGRAVARGFWRIHEANTLALWNYARRSPRYDGPVTLFRSEEALILEESWSRESHDAETLGWHRLVDGDLVIHPVPGDHNTLFRSPYVEVLAQRLRPHLEAAPVHHPAGGDRRDP